MEKEEITIEEALKIVFDYLEAMTLDKNKKNKVIKLIQALFVIKPRKAVKWKFLQEVKNSSPTT